MKPEELLHGVRSIHIAVVGEATEDMQRGVEV